MSSSTELWSALIAAVTSLVVFGLTQFVTGRREKRGRVDERRRAGLERAQDAALELRNALAEYGPLARHALGGTPDGQLGAARQRTDDAFAALEVELSRLTDDGVRTAITNWRGRARYHYISAEEVSTAEESALWRTMNYVVGNALRADRD
jgi:hypothetical protein